MDNALCVELYDADLALDSVKNIISIYGSARLPENHEVCKLTKHLAQRLAVEGFAIMSGGGGGIMAAANKGARAGGGVSIGLNIVLPHEQRANPYQDISLKFNYFASRKTVFLRYSVAHIVMMGGLGTLDELSECLTQMQTGKLARCPIILVGRGFWQGLVDWMKAQFVPNGLIKAEDLDLIYLVDSVDEVLDVIRNHVVLS